MATAATTASGCTPESAVVFVTNDGQALYAMVDDGYSDHWARSDDDGESWKRSEPPAPEYAPSTPRGNARNNQSLGSKLDCTADGTCWRVGDGWFIERVAEDGSAVEEFRFVDTDHVARTGCRDGGDGILDSITATETDRGSAVVASLGGAGIVVRQDDGTWQQTAILDVPPTQVERSTFVVVPIVLLVPMLILTAWRVSHLRLRPWQRALTAGGIGVFMTIVTAVGATFVVDFFVGTNSLMARILPIGVALSCVAALIAARWPRTA